MYGGASTISYHIFVANSYRVGADVMGQQVL